MQPRTQAARVNPAPGAKFEGTTESASQFGQKPIAARSAPPAAQLPEHLPFEGGQLRGCKLASETKNAKCTLAQLHGQATCSLC